MSNVPESQRPTVFQRVIDFDAEQGNTSSAKALIEKAVDKNITLSLNDPKAKQIMAEVMKEKEEKALAAKKKHEASSPPPVVRGKDTILIVKNGYLQAYPEVPLGKAIDAFLLNPKWESGQSQGGQMIVNVRGKMTYQDKPVNALIQFTVNDTAKTFEFYAFELNDIPQNDLMKTALMNKIVEEYRK